MAKLTRDELTPRIEQLMRTAELTEGQKGWGVSPAFHSEVVKLISDVIDAVTPERSPNNKDGQDTLAWARNSCIDDITRNKKGLDEWDGHTPQDVADRLRSYLTWSKP